MKTLLQIDASLFSDGGQSSVLAARFAARWMEGHPGGKILRRDLAANPVPHLTSERFQAFIAKPEERTTAQKAYVAESDRLIGELEAADRLVIGLPMYNFGIPSTLKAWIDHVARAGRTFRYTENGAEGLLADRPTTIFAARGGVYSNTPQDTQSAYMTQILNFIGIRDIEFVYAEGLSLGAAQREQSLERANETIERMAA